MQGYLNLQSYKGCVEKYVHDLFVVACWTGVRYSDLKRCPELLEAEWMANKGECPLELAFIQDKTDDRVRVPILDPVNRILTK